MQNTHRLNVEALLAEFDEEMLNTRRMLEKVPDEKLNWKPHERGSTLAKLASHIAAMPLLPELLTNMRRVDRPSDATSKIILLDRFEKNVAAGRAALANMDDARLATPIPVMPGVSKPLAQVLRSRVMNHLIHHRGQLSIYLRSLGETVPGMYGASADENA